MSHCKLVFLLCVWWRSEPSFRHGLLRCYVTENLQLVTRSSATHGVRNSHILQPPSCVGVRISALFFPQLLVFHNTVVHTHLPSFSYWTVRSLANIARPPRRCRRRQALQVSNVISQNGHVKAMKVLIQTRAAVKQQTPTRPKNQGGGAHRSTPPHRTGT
jgi:hypothetical protein